VLNERVDDQPTLADLKRLFAVVRPKVPMPFDTRYDEAKPQRGFNSSFRWISNQHRAPVPSAKHSLSFWLDCCRSWLRDRGAMISDVDAATLIAAVYAAGDIRYTPHNSSLGWVWELALMPPHHHGVAPTCAWREVLATGNVLAPSRPSRPMEVVRSPVRVYGG
jgi:hypothetical protein